MVEFPYGCKNGPTIDSWWKMHGSKHRMNALERCCCECGAYDVSNHVGRQTMPGKLSICTVLDSSREPQACDVSNEHFSNRFYRIVRGDKEIEEYAVFDYSLKQALPLLFGARAGSSA